MKLHHDQAKLMAKRPAPKIECPLQEIAAKLQLILAFPGPLQLPFQRALDPVSPCRCSSSLDFARKEAGR